MKRYFNTFAILVATVGSLSLAGCGEEYEMTKYEGFPYGNERTAGSGITYVRVKMMPEKGPVLEEVQLPEEIEEAVVEPEAVEPAPVEEFPKEAEELFQEMQKK